MSRFARGGSQVALAHGFEVVVDDCSGSVSMAARKILPIIPVRSATRGGGCAPARARRLAKIDDSPDAFSAQLLPALASDPVDVFVSGKTLSLVS
ncbi:MAG: hypothetical protein DLM58_23685 [Pseudonocardiales bacterium]|nr:MAG: hypothetical protein DLM58_23685 [Pseudonocardiales bacterium]